MEVGVEKRVCVPFATCGGRGRVHKLRAPLGLGHLGGAQTRIYSSSRSLALDRHLTSAGPSHTTETFVPISDIYRDNACEVADLGPC